MLKELLQEMEALWLKGHGAQVIQPPAEPKHVYLLREGEQVTRLSAEPEPRRHQCRDMATLVKFAADFASPEQAVCLWYDVSGVTALLDDEDRRDTLRLTLAPCPRFQALAQLDKAGGDARRFNQPALLRFLRVGMAGAVAPNWVQAVRKMKFRQASSTEREVQHGRASLGRSIEAELTGSEGLPEELVFKVRVWEGVPSQPEVFVACDLEIDAQAETFQLTPLPGQVQAAVRTAEAWLGDSLNALADEARAEGDRLHVYYGQP